jgi:hypothetical protein
MLGHARPVMRRHGRDTTYGKQWKTAQCHTKEALAPRYPQPFATAPRRLCPEMPSRRCNWPQCIRPPLCLGGVSIYSVSLLCRLHCSLASGSWQTPVVDRADGQCRTTAFLVGFARNAACKYPYQGVRQNLGVAGVSPYYMLDYIHLLTTFLPSPRSPVLLRSKPSCATRGAIAVPLLLASSHRVRSLSRL